MTKPPARLRRSQRRLVAIVAALGAFAVAIGFALYGLRDSVAYFYTPTEIAAKAKPGQRVRIGGLVEAGSVVKAAGGIVDFAVTDGPGRVAVRYRGEPPDLFGEGQGVVAEGVWRGGPTFEVDRVLAKHDENYMPAEVVDALKKSGEWKGDGGGDGPNR